MGNDRKVVDDSLISLEASDWYKDAVVYQIYIRSFQDSNNDGIGDIPGIVSRLDYLKSLGVQVLWLSPFNTSPNDDNGYDVSDYYSINPEYGTLDDFAELVSQCKARNLKIMMDLVLNHSSDQHPWFLESKSSKTNAKRDWYIWREGKTDHPKGLNSRQVEGTNHLGAVEPPNNWDSYFGGSAWEYDPTTQEYYLHIFSTKQPDLNWANPQVRQEFASICKYWIDQGVEAFRLDAVHHIGKPPGLPDAPEDPNNPWHYRLYKNTKETHRYLRELNQKVFVPGKVFSVGETGGTNPQSARKYVDRSRKELDVIFHFDRFYFGNKTLAQGFTHDLNRWYKGLSQEGWDAQFLSNHDLPRQVSNFGDDRYLRGKSAKALATLILTTWGTPFLYQGEELGFPNPHYSSTGDFPDRHARRNLEDDLERQEDWDLAYGRYHQKNRDNSRSPMAWDSTKNAGFTSPTIEPWMGLAIHSPWINLEDEERWDSSVPPSYGPGGYQGACGILQWYRELIGLRNREMGLRRGDFAILSKNHPHILAFERTIPGATHWIVLINLSGHSSSINLNYSIDGGNGKLMMTNYYQPAGKQKAFESNTLDQLSGNLQLKPWECRLYAKTSKSSLST